MTEDIRRRLSLAQTPRTAPRSRTAFAKTMYASCKEQFIEEDINRTDRYRKLTSSVHKPRTSYKGPLRGSPGSWRRSGKRPGTATRSDDSVFALTRPSTAGTAPMGLSSPLRSPHRGNAGYGDRPGTSGPASDPMARARQGAVSPYAQTVSKDTRDRILYAKFVVNGNKGRPVDQDAALNYFEGQLEHAADHGFKLSGRLCQRWRRAVPGVINTKYLVNKVAEIARAPTGQPEIKRAAAVLCLWLRLHAKRVRSEFVETHTRVFGEIEEVRCRRRSTACRGICSQPLVCPVVRRGVDSRVRVASNTNRSATECDGHTLAVVVDAEGNRRVLGLACHSGKHVDGTSNVATGVCGACSLATGSSNKSCDRGRRRHSGHCPLPGETWSTESRRWADVAHASMGSPRVAHARNAGGRPPHRPIYERAPAERCGQDGV